MNHYVEPFGLLSAALVGDDEAAIYRFDYRYTAEKVSDFTSSNDGLGKALSQIKKTSRGQADRDTNAVLVGHFFPVAPTSDLRKYAEPTGGDVYRVTDEDRATALHTTFARIIERARHQYVLTYVSNNVVPGPLPVNRKIEVKTNRRGLKSSYRTGYLQHPALK